MNNRNVLNQPQLEKRTRII